MAEEWEEIRLLRHDPAPLHHHARALPSFAAREPSRVSAIDADYCFLAAARGGAPANVTESAIFSLFVTV